MSIWDRAWGNIDHKFEFCNLDKSLRFNLTSDIFIFSLNLLKSRVFVIYLMGLFFPVLRVEQAHFSYLTTCLTTCGEFCTISRYKKCKICTFNFVRKCNWFALENCSYSIGKLFLFFRICSLNFYIFI